MKVLNIHNANDVRLEDYTLPEIGPRDVTVRMKAVGICGSDLSYIRHGGIMNLDLPVMPIGHECAGEVVTVGSEVIGIKPGDAVVVNPMNTPSNVGNGGPEGAFVDELLVRDARLGDSILPIPADVPFDIAATCEPLAVALHGVNRARVKAGERVVVFGCGPIGLGMVLWLVDRGVTDVVAFDLAPERRDLALALGARAAFDSREVDLLETLGELHGTEMCLHKPSVGTDAFLDAAGACNIVPDVIALGKFHARLVVTALYYDPVEVPLGTMLLNELSLTTAVGYPDEMPEVVAALPRLKDKIALLISHRLPFERIFEGLEIAATPASAKVIIEMQ